MANASERLSSTAAQASTDTAVAADTATSLRDQLPEFSDWLPAAVKPYWEIIAQYPIIGAVVIALVFYIAAFLIRGAIIRSIGTLAANTETQLDDRVISGIKRPLFKLIFLFGLTLAVKAAQLPFATDFIVNVLLSVMLVILMRTAFFLCTEILAALSRNHHRFAAIEERTIPLFDLVSKLLIMLVGGYLLLMVWGVNPVGWLASAGIVGLAVGFAAQDTLANLFAGFFILIDSPYKLGDYVNLDSGERGRVTHIGMRSTRMLTRDDVEVTIPNSVMGNAKIINESGGPDEKMRLRIAVGVAYGSDVHVVSELLAKTALENEEVCRTPEPRARMRGFGESSLDFELLAWIEKPELRGLITHQLNMQIYDALNHAYIEIPFPQRDLHVKQMPGR